MGCSPKRLWMGRGYLGCEGKEEGSLSLTWIGGHFVRDGWTVSQTMGSTTSGGKGGEETEGVEVRARTRRAADELGCRCIEGWKVTESWSFCRMSRPIKGVGHRGRMRN